MIGLYIIRNKKFEVQILQEQESMSEENWNLKKGRKKTVNQEKYKVAWWVDLHGKAYSFSEFSKGTNFAFREAPHIPTAPAAPSPLATNRCQNFLMPGKGQQMRLTPN